MTDSAQTEIQIKVAKARPFSGGLLGIVIGLCGAVLLQQHGIWPLDLASVLLTGAVGGLIGVGLTRIGREAATAATAVMLTLLIGAGVWGAINLFSNQSGVLNGGCQVSAQSSVDNTVVTDTSRNDPFRIDPDGGLSWDASSPVVFRNFTWEVWVELGGVQIVIESEFEDNASESMGNSGSVDNVGDEIDSYGLPASQMRGSFKVGGSAASCNGFAYVYLVSKPFETITSWVAAGLGLLTLIILLLVAFTGRKRPVEIPVESADESGAGATAEDAGEADTDDTDVEFGEDDVPEADVETDPPPPSPGDEDENPGAGSERSEDNT